jgi:glycosyltransferase involved in cell wall biosynthesis
VILVDGGSRDDTVAVARKLRPDLLIIGQTRKGKGNALACGFEAATGDFIVMLDADGSTDPAEIPRFVDALKGVTGSL